MASSTTPFKTVLVVGASGSIGSVIVTALLAEASLTVTALQRASSKATLPAGLRTITIPDSYPEDELEAAFRGQDVVLNAMATEGVAEQRRFVDAAIAAGVRRYVPSEFGLNNTNPAAQKLTSVFGTKGAIQAYVRSRAEAGDIEWTTFTPGLWLRWSMERQLIGMHVAEGRMVYWDQGDAPFSVTTEENTALAVVRGLTTHASLTRNQNVFLQDFVTTQRDVHDAIERVLGKTMAVETIDGKKYIADLQAAVARGDDPIAHLKLIEPAFAMSIASWLEREDGHIFTADLGLPKTNVDEVVREALTTLKLL